MALGSRRQSPAPSSRLLDSPCFLFLSPPVARSRSESTSQFTALALNKPSSSSSSSSGTFQLARRQRVVCYVHHLLIYTDIHDVAAHSLLVVTRAQGILVYPLRLRCCSIGPEASWTIQRRLPHSAPPPTFFSSSSSSSSSSFLLNFPPPPPPPPQRI